MCLDLGDKQEDGQSQERFQHYSFLKNISPQSEKKIFPEQPLSVTTWYEEIHSFDVIKSGVCHGNRQISVCGSTGDSTDLAFFVFVKENKALLMHFLLLQLAACC